MDIQNLYNTLQHNSHTLLKSNIVDLFDLDFIGVT